MTISGVVLAAVITFEGIAYGAPGRANLMIGGLRFSPQCYAYVVNRAVHPLIPSEYLVLDDENNCGVDNGGPNQEHTGLGSLSIDRFGEPFDFLGLTGRSYYGNLQYHIRSSEGHHLIHGEGVLDVSWHDVTWVSLQSNSNSFHAGQGYDDIRYNIDSPGTLWLIGIAGLLFFGVTRKLGWQ
jgi:hypothetical protein